MLLTAAVEGRYSALARDHHLHQKLLEVGAVILGVAVGDVDEVEDSFITLTFWS